MHRIVQVSRSVATFMVLVGACADLETLPRTELPTVAQLLQDASILASRPAQQDAGALAGKDISTLPIDYEDPALRCYALTAYASPSAKDTPHTVSTAKDLYTGFLLKAPWKGTQYIKSMRSVVDNRAVLHHLMLLLQHRDGPEKIIPNGTGVHADGDMIYAWAPGAQDLWLGKDVGIEMPEGALMMLENHYNNRTGAAVRDASGVEVCVTPRKPRHLAGMSYVGTDMILGTSATGTCTHDSPEPVHLIMAFPHMHTKGLRMRVGWTRADGTQSVVHDQAFDFNYQRVYVYDDLVLQPGDKLTTTCTYDAPAVFGKGSDDEMCFFFSLHYPAGALSRRNLFQVLHGPNVCMD